MAYKSFHPGQFTCNIDFSEGLDLPVRYLFFSFFYQGKKYDVYVTPGWSRTNPVSASFSSSVG